MYVLFYIFYVINVIDECYWMFLIVVLLWCCKYVKCNVDYDGVIFILKISENDKNNRN